MFYAYRLPGSHEIVTGIRREDSPWIAGRSFLVWPAKQDSSNSLPFIIRAAEKFDIRDLNNIASLSFGEYQGKPSKETSRSVHSQMVNDVICCIHSASPLKKCVVSRLIRKNIEIDFEATFRELCNRYADAFIFCFSTPSGEIWMGASPELLLEAGPESVNSMALAGTRPAGSGEEEWDEKNLEEQGIVTRYLIEKFREGGLTPSVSDTFTKCAGPVEHLCTLISAPREGKSDATLLSMAYSLYPTPALGGEPLNEALEFIAKETRRYYSGCCGPVRDDGTFSIYVNLRSMEIDPKGVSLYVGGGITGLSEPESEWEETERKSATLLNAIKTKY